jgi:hypothetical protein
LEPRFKKLKKKKVDVYLPTLDMRNRWKKAASEKGVSLSKFVVEYVENQLHEDKSYASRVEMQDSIDSLEEENVQLRRKRNHLEIVVDKLQEELRVYRLEPFLDENFQGIRGFEQKLIDVLKQKNSVRDDKIFREVGIKPVDSKGMKALQRQLLLLERYGLIKKTLEGWSWIH